MDKSVAYLPPKVDLETKEVLKKLASTHRYLAELKGKAASMPNESILLNTLVLQEAKDSSEVENIITTHDELYKESLFGRYGESLAAKEVYRYAGALRKGYELVSKNKLLTLKTIHEIYEELEKNNTGFRRRPGTALRNLRTREIVYTPPQTYEEILPLMQNLELFINDDSILDIDPLIKMAIIHFQFETIHPFYDGNGRTGRIINILYLVMLELLDLPILYMSRYIIRNKQNYYDYLQKVRDEDDWESWVLFILDAVEVTSKQTILMVSGIKEIMQKYKHGIRSELPKIYSQDLINNLFKHPYTKISFIERDLRVGRVTASRYLEMLVEKGFLEKEKVGRHNYYINTPLVALLMNVPEV